MKKIKTSTHKKKCTLIATKLTIPAKNLQLRVSATIQIHIEVLKYTSSRKTL